MTKPVDPYTRMYWRLIDDEKFVEIYPDDHHFALYVRLLMAADMSWPASASLPYATRKTSLQKLCDVGLVDVLASGRYRIRGLDAERRKRQQKASNAAASRWEDDEQPARSANGTDEHPPSNANGMPSRAEPRKSQDETRRALSAREGLPHITAAIQEAGESITGHGILSAGDRQLTELDRLCEDHAAADVVEAMSAVAGGGRKSWRQLVWDTTKRLEPFSDGRGTEDDEIDRLVAQTNREYAEQKGRHSGG